MGHMSQLLIHISGYSDNAEVQMWHLKENQLQFLTSHNTAVVSDVGWIEMRRHQLALFIVLCSARCIEYTWAVSVTERP